MEQPTAETPRQGNNDAQSSMGQATFSFDNWATMDNIFPGLDVQTQDSQMAAAHQQQAPQGITWDHPIFSHASQDHGRHASFSQQDDHLRDFYAGTPQAWGQTTSTPQTTTNGVPGQTYGLSHEHPYPLQPQIRHDQVSFDARTMSPENLAAYQYSIPPGHYYQQPGLQPANAYNQQQQQQQHRHQPIAPRPAPTPQQTMLSAGAQSTHNNRYVVPASSVTGNTQARSFHDYGDGNSSINYQNTIDPQFLSTLQDAANIPPQSSQNQFLFYNPNASSYERPNDPKAYQAFPENLSNLNAEQLNARQHIGPGLMGQLPQLTPFPTGAGMITSNGHQKPLTPQTISPAKKPRGRPKKNLPNASNAKARSESISDSSDSDLEFEEPDEPSPLPAVRPADDEGAIQYDTIKAVWSPRNKYPSVDKIKNALVAFKDVVKAVRDEWKSLSQSMKDAENQNNNEKALELKNRVAHQRKLINTVLSTTIEKGHPVIVEKLGEHPMAVAALYSFLLDRHQASDYEGMLLVNILTLLSRFTTMDDDVLLKTNVSKLLPRIIKKGIQPGKDLAQKILDNAAQSTKRKHESSGSSPGKDAVPDKLGEVSSNGGVKRIRDGETNGLPATKKIVTPATAAKGSSATKMVNNNGVKAADGKPSAAASAARPKANIVPPKPTSLFGSLTSASKKPGTSNAARAAAAAAAAKEKGHNASERKDSPQPAPAKPAFSFGDILADLNKKEEANVKKPSENNPSETEEERQKRLRKEARRRLRVSWKPDDSLAEIRIFTHDPDEVVGLGDDLKRDVDDIKGEGRMLKLHKDLDEDDEEEVEPQEEEMHPWTNLLLVDQDLGSEDQSNNFIKRGGTREPDSPEKLAQENREATTLMVFYTSAADVPTSPKEPPAAADDEPAIPELPFGEPDDKVKARSARYFAMFNPQPVPTPIPAPAASAAPVTPVVQGGGPLDIANLLKVIQSAPQQARSTPPPVPPPQTAQNLPNPLANLEQTINMFRQQQQQQQSVQPVMPHIPQIPQLPIVPPIPQVPISAPSGQPIDLQKILAVLNAQKQLAQPQPQVLPQMPAAQPGIAPNLAALVAQLSGNRIGTPVAQQQQQQQQMPHQSSSGVYEDPERKRYRDMGNAHDNTGFGQQQGNAKRPRMYVDPEAKKHPRAGSVACRFWREGKCLKGEDCTFRHDPADLI